MRILIRVFILAVCILISDGSQISLFMLKDRSSHYMVPVFLEGKLQYGFNKEVNLSTFSCLNGGLHVFELDDYNK
jgi:hypothetical protein